MQHGGGSRTGPPPKFFGATAPKDLTPLLSGFALTPGRILDYAGEELICTRPRLDVLTNPC